LLVVALLWTLPQEPEAAHGASRSITSTTLSNSRPILAPAADEVVAARQQFEGDTKAYWNSIADRRRTRIAKRRNNQQVLMDDYVLIQPPVYSEALHQVDSSAPPEQEPPLRGKYVPVVSDFLQSAEEEFHFKPQRPKSELEYKSAYAKGALASGLTREQVVRIYAFESGGNGTYDTQAGLEKSTLGSKAISTAIGYNQLLATNSVELIAENGSRFIELLKAKAEALMGEARDALDRKILVLRDMVDFSRSVPDDWSEHETLASTPKGLGIHAMNLDIDVGPLLQIQKLLDSVVYARNQGYSAVLTAAELEMMNLSGDGNGLDILTMPPEWRDQVPTSNFFQRSVAMSTMGSSFGTMWFRRCWRRLTKLWTAKANCREPKICRDCFPNSISAAGAKSTGSAPLDCRNLVGAGVVHGE
jgi:hypothetical protein